jgi:uncharacterized CHY-type Zn-finger protein
MEHMIFGTLTDDNTRCTHYNSVLDIITIKFKCCNKYYACIHCHNDAADHAETVWLKNEFDTKAILCGNCKAEMTIAEYLDCKNECPACSSKFNPKCSNHYDYYFEQ